MNLLRPSWIICFEQNMKPFKVDCFQPESAPNQSSSLPYKNIQDKITCKFNKDDTTTRTRQLTRDTSPTPRLSWLRPKWMEHLLFPLPIFLCRMLTFKKYNSCRVLCVDDRFSWLSCLIGKKPPIGERGVACSVFDSTRTELVTCTAFQAMVAKLGFF